MGKVQQLVAGESRVARHFHLPFQSGSNEILAAMRRRYRMEHFVDLVERIVAAVPDCGIGTDMICGFPGETDAHFQQSFDTLAGLPISYLHPFTYSVRPGSEAEGMGDPVPSDVKKRRVRALKKLSADKNRTFRAKHVGQLVDVLPEHSRRSGSDHVSGWTDNYLRVDLGRRNHVPGDICQVEVTGMSEDALTGRPVGWS